MKYLFYLIVATMPAIFQLGAYQDNFQIKVESHPAPRKGTPHIHWCTMCGADNRYEMLKETIQIIEPYFDEIHIIDNGSTDETPDLVNLSPKVTYKRIENWENNWARCYLEAIRHVCRNEWFMFHDSDERPSPYLLRSLKDITKWANKQKVNALKVQSCHHSYDDRGTLSSNYMEIIQHRGHEKVNFLKRTNLEITAFGGHTGFHPTRPEVQHLREYNPQCFYNHYKSQSSTRLSLFAHGFMYPTTFDGLKPYAGEILSVRNELKITDMKQLFQMIYTKEIPQKIINLVSGWEFSNGEAKEVWELIIRDRCEFRLPTYCNQPCCVFREQKPRGNVNRIVNRR